MTSLPTGGLSIPLNPNQTDFDGIFVHYMSQLHSTEKNKHSLLYQLWSKMGKKSNLAPFKFSKKKWVSLHSFAELCGAKSIKSHVRHQFLQIFQHKPLTQKTKKKSVCVFAMMRYKLLFLDSSFIHKVLKVILHILLLNSFRNPNIEGSLILYRW